jgi:hypothetical protein
MRSDSSSRYPFYFVLCIVYQNLALYLSYSNEGNDDGDNTLRFRYISILPPTKQIRSSDRDSVYLQNYLKMST